MTREQILTIKDRDERLNAIGENLSAFDEANAKARVRDIYKTVNGDLERARYSYSMSSDDLAYWKSLERERQARQRQNAEIMERFINGGGRG